MLYVAEQLKTRPGRWARITVSQAAAFNYVKDHPEIEITTHNRSKSNEAIYIGEPRRHQ